MRSIILVRHGRPAHEGPRWLNARDAARWLDLYDHSGLKSGDAPPPAVRELASTADIIVSSDLPRALQSAELLACNRRVLATAMLRESRMRASQLPLRMPIAGWQVVIVLRWLFFMLRENSDMVSERRRAREVVHWLIELSQVNDSVLVVTHNAFRSLLVRSLYLNDWVEMGRVGRYEHWSAWTLRPRHDIYTRNDATAVRAV
jgi:broad specificity phosphatase PhoE